MLADFLFNVVNQLPLDCFSEKLDQVMKMNIHTCLLYTSDAADERSSVDLGGRRIIKKKTQINYGH